MFDMNLNIESIRNEHHKDLLREANEVRLAQSALRNDDVIQMARNALGRGLVAVGNQLMDSPKRS